MLNDLLNPRAAAVALVLLVLAGCASTPRATAPTSASVRGPAPASCVATPTGLLAPPKDCPVYGHTWTQDDISRTGAQTTAGALRLLDPTLTVTGH